MCHALMNNRAKKEGKRREEQLINAKRETSTNLAVMTHHGQYLHLVSPGSTVPRRKSGRDEARRISCSTGEHVAEVKRGLINHIHRYNVYTRPTFRDLRAHMYIHACHIAHVYERSRSSTRKLYCSGHLNLLSFFCVHFRFEMQCCNAAHGFDTRYANW